MQLKFILLVLLLSGNLKAQTFSQEFQNSIDPVTRDFGIAPHSTGYSICLTKLIVDKVKLIRTDFNGIIQSARIYEPVDTNYQISCRHIIALPDGTQLVSGKYSSINSSVTRIPYIMSIDTDGNVNWAKTIGTNGSSPPTMTLLSDSSVLVTFDYSNPGVHKVYCKLDSNGNFSSFMDGTTSLMHGTIFSIIPNDESFDIIFPNGNLINIRNDLTSVNWQRKYYNQAGMTFNRCSNGDYIFASAQTIFPGYLTVFRTDSSGNLIWAKYIEAWEGNLQNQGSIFDIIGFHFVKEDSNGNIIAVPDSEGGSVGSYAVIFDANGNYIDNYRIEVFKSKKVILNSDQYLIGGYDKPFGIPFNFLFEKRNLTTRFPCDTITLSHSIVDGSDMALPPDTLTLTPITFDIEDFNVHFTTETIMQNDYCDIALHLDENDTFESKMSVYPNPTNDYVWIDCNCNIVNIKLYNSVGQVLKTTNETFIDLSNYTNGIYFFEIEIEEKQKVIKKMVKN